MRTRAKGLSHPYNSDSHGPRPMTPAERLQPFQLFKLAKVTRGGYWQAVPKQHIYANKEATATKDTKSGEHCFAVTGLRKRRTEEKRARERLEGFVSRVETTSLPWVGDRGQTQMLDLKGLILKIIHRTFLLDVRCAIQRGPSSDLGLLGCNNENGTGHEYCI